MPSRVYVIELKPEAGKRRDPRIPWVYVGSSARDPELRLAQHLRGYKSGRLVKRFGLRLRPDLYEDLGPFKGSKTALEAEQRRARELARCGFVAHCDGTSHGLKSASIKEWGAKRVDKVVEHLDTAIHELVDSSWKKLSPETCAELLYGTRGFWVEKHLDLADPPPAYGMFAHVQRAALQRRVKTLVEGGELEWDEKEGLRS